MFPFVLAAGHSYSVLPCALEHDVVIAVGTNGVPGADVKVANTNLKYPTGAFPADPAAPVDRSGPLQVLTVCAGRAWKGADVRHASTCARDCL